MRLRTNIDKTRRAAADPNRPGQECKAAPGTYTPVVDRARCEAKAECVEVCPYNIFKVGPINPDDFNKLSFLGRLKSRAHGKLTAYTPNAADCRACGLCVVACPEKAINLIAN